MNTDRLHFLKQRWTVFRHTRFRCGKCGRLMLRGFDNGKYVNCDLCREKERNRKADDREKELGEDAYGKALLEGRGT